MTEGRGQGWRKGLVTASPCSEDDCDTLAHAKGKCAKHYEQDRRRAGLSKRVRPRKPREVVEVTARPKTEPKHQGPRGIDKFVPMGGGTNPSPFEDGGPVSKLPDGYLPGSHRIGSYYGVRVGGKYFRVHRDDACTWIDRVFFNVLDLWEYSEVGRYVIDRRTLARVPVKLCQFCETRLGKVLT